MNDRQYPLLDSKSARSFIERQCAMWDTARYNYEALAQVKERELFVGRDSIKLQFNPARMTSSSARVDADSLRARPCFLCEANRPQEQQAIPFPGGYEILVNPYPIFPYHLTIPSVDHQPQAILRRLGAMLQLARQLDEFVVFYNGPCCGASAPDHIHFQAGNKGILPIEKEEFFLDPEKRAPEIARYQSAALRVYPFYSRPFFEIRSSEEIEAVYLFSLIYDNLEEYAFSQKILGDCAQTPVETAETLKKEPMMNILVWYVGEEWIIHLFPRKRHRPLCYDAPGEENILLSPGAVDMGGLFVIPQKRDFDKITSGDMQRILTEVCFDPDQIEAIVKLIKR